MKAVCAIYDVFGSKWIERRLGEHMRLCILTKEVVERTPDHQRAGYGQQKGFRWKGGLRTPKWRLSHAGYLVVEVITSHERVGTVHCLATRLDKRAERTRGREWEAGGGWRRGQCDSVIDDNR